MYTDRDGVIVLGDSPTPSNNITIKTPAVADGSLEIYQGVPGALGSKLYEFKPNGTAGTGPAFSAYQTGTAQVLSASAWSKVVINAEEFDTASCFDPSVNYRFTPNLAGYYQVNGNVQYLGAATSGTAIYKNGSMIKVGSIIQTNGSASNVSALVYLNGTSDYIELYSYSNVTATVSTGVAATWFQAFLARAA